MHFEKVYCVRVFRFLGLMLLLASCLNEPDCIITSTNLVKVNFKNLENKARTIVLDSIIVAGLPVPYYKGESTSAVQLPVSPDEDGATFTFVYEGVRQTLSLTYIRGIEVISPDCGAYPNFSGLGVMTTSFDSLNLVNDRLLINATVNLEIYLE